MDIIKIVLIFLAVFLVMGGIGTLTDYILYRNEGMNCKFGYGRDCRYCSTIDGCLHGLRKKRYSKRWRDG